jgi:anti-sigma B factor antagonist
VHVPYRSIDDSLLRRVRLTMVTARQRGRFRRERPVVVRAAAEIDIATAPRLCADVASAFASGAHALRIDLSATTFMDSSGLHVLLDAAQRALALDRELTIVGALANVRRVIDIAGVGEQLPLSDEVSV